MLINFVPGEECRIAIIRDGRLEEFYQERSSAESHVGNIYKAKVLNVEASIQAAFVDFGLPRNGFLHISDLHPMYFLGKDREAFERVGSKTPHRDRPPIQKCLRRGQELLVQVIKEGIGTKGPTLTSYLSIPGRFLVMMPHMQRTGVSRKIEDDEARRQARNILKELEPPDEFGFIVRTAGTGQTKAELKRDLAYLQRLWRDIEQRMKVLQGTGELYTESDLVIRTIRDVFSSEIKRIIVDDISAARRARAFLIIASPRSRSKILYYRDPVPLLHRFDVEHQIDSIHSRVVPLSSGGSLVIDQTEALVAIDVNSGKSRRARDAESNAYQTNIEAVDEICRQLRLRDLGGVIVNDLIDMRESDHRRKVEAHFRETLKRDRARIRLGSISTFGILEMTRQRMRPSLETAVSAPCSACTGTGHTKTPESVVLDIMRLLALAMHHDQVARVELTISPDVAFRLLNRKRSHLVHLEQRFDKQVMVRVGGETIDYVHINAFDSRGGAVETAALARMENMAPEIEQNFVDVATEPLAAEPMALDHAAAVAQATGEPGPIGETEASEPSPAVRSRSRRRRRGGRGRRKKADPGVQDEKPQPTAVPAAALAAASPRPTMAQPLAPKPGAATQTTVSATPNAGPGEPQGTKAPRRRRRRGAKAAQDTSKNLVDGKTTT